MEATPLASLTLTHVHYNPDDPVSYLCAWLALVPQALCVIYVTLIWSTREIEILFMFAGQMGCEALNFLLKRLIKEERPKQMNGKGYGMPSSHAQFTAYFSISLALFLLLRHRPLPPPSKQQLPYSHTPLTLLERFLLSFCAVIVAASVALSRIYLSYHTPLQVSVGFLAGTVSAIAWFGVTELARQEGWVEWGLESWVGRMGRWRDLVVEEDLAESGWRRWEEKRKGKEAESMNGGDGKKTR
ncbi:hypothetical protein MMC28_010621 [Mycoblastus sanguinarius]|nr:hypothetical protein [Mycoblastus sanguinarius]